MSSSTFPIGVFDSGMGGLTVLRALKQILPNESYLYLGDTARLPYGTKSIATVQNYAKQMAHILIQRQIKALVVACNTATTAALPLLQNSFPQIPIIGVLEPGAQAAVRASVNQHIYIMATETTIASQGYQKLILAHRPNAQLKGKAANVLVSLAEEGLTQSSVAKEALRHYLNDLEREDTLILGCTHFPVFIPLLEELFPHVNLINPAHETAQTVEQTLRSHHLLAPRTSPETHYLVTDSVTRFQKVGEIFLGQELPPSEIELIDAC